MARVSVGIGIELSEKEFEAISESVKRFHDPAKPLTIGISFHNGEDELSVEILRPKDDDQLAWFDIVHEIMFPMI